MIYAITDLETTGGSQKNTKITEIAIYKHNGLEIIDKYVTLVNPETPIPAFITQLTGIHDDMVVRAPKFFEVAKDIIEFMEDCVFVAHNVGFDYGVLRGEFKSLGYDFRKPHLCTVRASRIVIPGHDSYSLGKLSKALGIDLNGRHRASGDALATCELFKLIYKKDINQLNTFIQTDINPAILHPNLDLHLLDEIPNKTGIYKFYNDTNQLIYIGKSKHILTRVKQHLKNTKTKKGLEMRAEIARIDYEITGSELVSLLYESALIKNNQPKYNKALKRNKFSHGLFSYTDNSGYKNLFIDSLTKNKAIPLTTFTSSKDAKSYLENISLTHLLCQKLLGIYPTQSSCFNYHTKQCFGACIKKEPTVSYNARVDRFIEKLTFEEESFYIVETGRHRKEVCLILIENGVYIGYGYANDYAMKQPVETWKEAIEMQIDDRDARTIIRYYMRSNKNLKIKSLS